MCNSLEDVDFDKFIIGAGDTQHLYVYFGQPINPNLHSELIKIMKKTKMIKDIYHPLTFGENYAVLVKAGHEFEYRAQANTIDLIFNCKVIDD